MRSLGVILALALCVAHIEGQFYGYVAQSWQLLRTDNLETPEYSVLQTSSAKDPDSYEERLYPASKWACTARTVPKGDGVPSRSMFFELFRYFAGDNDLKKEIDLTIPVNTFVEKRANDSLYAETCLVLPAKFQKSPPKANNPSIFIEDKPELVVLTRRVSGYLITDNAWEEEATSLKKILEEKEPDTDFSSYYRNGYDAPMRIFNRRNEVWYVKRGDAAKKAIERKQLEDKKKSEDKKTDEKKTEEKKTEVKKTEEKKKDEEKKTEEKKVAAVDDKKVDDKKVDDKKAEPAQNRE